jgi:micrococcal nuclease
VAAAPATAGSQAISGRADWIADGDTFTLISTTGEEIEVRLGDIDAPEGDQPYGERARLELERLIEGRPLRVEPLDVDRLGRLVGRVYAGDTDVCARLVEGGAAWAYREFLRDADLLELESRARAARRGLWAAATPVPPWQWRRQHDAPRVERGAVGACDIKGNVSASGERIYHLPGQQYYDRTRIDTTAGERFFCSEAEARAAGFRRSKR